MPDLFTARLCIGTGAQDLARLHPWLEEAAAPHGLPQRLLYGMQVVLEEIVMNIVMHGGATSDEAVIEVTLDISPAATQLTVTDSGRAFDPLAQAQKPAPASLEEVEPGGAGLKLMRHYCRDIAYERHGGRNVLTLFFSR
jgi:serine/threonine-protein kinase RsbW